MMESEAHDRVLTGGNSPPQPSSSSKTTTVVITVSSAASGDPETRREDAPGGGEVVVEQQRKGVVNETGQEKGSCVVVDVKCRSDWDPDAEKVCRICHLSPEHDGPDNAGLIQLGCGCKDELGMAHRKCAEAWFRVKGNRCCEICGVNAKNITGEEDGSFMEEWHERRMLGNSSNRRTSERGGCWRGQPFCNFLTACLVIAFILPWFFRVNMF